MNVTSQLTQQLEEEVILVDTSDRQIGIAEKLQAHRKGLLHRAFSIFVLNSQNQLLLQKRAKHKYHSGGLWTNTCCSHPRHEETTLLAAHRRLQEFDHVFVGYSDREPVLNPEEAEDWKWIDLKVLQTDIQENPQSYTYWLRDCCDRFIAELV